MSEGSNGKRPDSGGVKTSTRLLIDKILFVGGLIMFVVGLVGEIRGWWDAVGVIVSLAGLVVGAFSAMDQNGVALLEGHSATHSVLMRIASGQAAAAGTQSEIVERQGMMLGNQTRMLENQDTMIQNQETMIHNQDEMVVLLERIADTLENQDR